MKSTRIKGVAVLLLISFSLILYRLADVQLFSSENFGHEEINLLEKSVEQRTQQLSINDGRGHFVDRNHVEMTKANELDIVFFPFLRDMDYPLEEVSTTLGIPDYNLNYYIKNSEDPFYISDILNEEVTEEMYTALQDLNFPGIYPVERNLDEDPIYASHFLGLVREKKEENETASTDSSIGISGFEAVFEPFLATNGEEKLLYHVDGHGEPLFGLNVKYQGVQDAFYPVQIKTTIDIEIQQEAERILDEHKITKGGLVLLDVKSRDILAMVSRPQINYKNPYLNEGDSKDDTLHNYMLKANFPGSIFKTVIAAAAIEHPSINIHRMFNCDLGIKEGVPPKRELGMLSFTESFAQSCNRTFVEIAQEMMEEDPYVIDHYVEKLGLKGTVGWKGDVFHFKDFNQFPKEETTTIWGQENHRFDDNMIANTAIGQQNVKITPLAIANMMATIASDGMKKEVRGASRVLYKSGATMATFEEHPLEENRLSSYSALRLRELLYEVANSNEGTGKHLQGLEVAGKSGTAEVVDGIDPYHWFAGFFPYEQPRYAMVVVDLDKQNALATNGVFKDMVQHLNQKTF
ncbi:penicillin-binding transpeptidase domain-containing protein [Pontibacillus yanchengensis]|uniref:Penicillin-binding protein n=1 Tax=Pontibacillus yanchengensis Y32 TaxID=1385514 RepID=A0A0A2T930_9BACI|nr:penicillin-binding transpeptidase domain-containing protein [Pontibacillus yanchengensis]KGP70898.1 penicillin-binding protein [Pontibacillus yanchengensis Y32]